MKTFSKLLFLVVILFCAGCIKSDKVNPEVIKHFEHDLNGFIVEYAIPERQCVYGLKSDENGNYIKVEYNLTTKTFAPSKYMPFVGNYSATKPNEIYICTFNNQTVNIYNFLDSSLYKSYTYSSPVDDATIANGKLYIVNSGFVGYLRVIDLETNIEIDNCVVSNVVSEVYVSPDGSRIYSADYKSVYRAIFNNSTVVNDLVLNTNIPFKKGNFKMSASGRSSLITDRGYRNANLNVIYYLPQYAKTDTINNFSISTDGNSLAAYTGKNFILLDSLNQFETNIPITKIFKDEANDYYSVNNVVMFYMNNKHYAALNYRVKFNSEYLNKSLIIQL